MANDLLERAKKYGTPLIDGDEAIFVWEGDHPPVITGDFNEWEVENRLHFNEVEPRVWSAAYRLPPDAYLEYAFILDGVREYDPLNPRMVTDGFGKRNHFFYMYESGPTPLVKRQKGVPRGEVRVEHLATEGLVTGVTRRVYFYEPPAAGLYPLLVVWDGEDYLRKAWLARIVDNLIYEGRIRPIGMALIDSGGPARIPELACSEGTLAFLIDQVIPEAEEQLDLTDIEAEPAGWGLLGASLGGLMALFTALRLPEIFSSVISQSGAFNQLVDESMIFDLAAYSGGSSLDIWMEAGKLESLLPENRRMRDILQKRGHAVTYREFSAGHNYTAWRDHVWRGLEAMFPPVGKGVK